MTPGSMWSVIGSVAGVIATGAVAVLAISNAVAPPAIDQDPRVILASPTPGGDTAPVFTPEPLPPIPVIEELPPVDAAPVTLPPTRQSPSTRPPKPKKSPAARPSSTRPADRPKVTQEPPANEPLPAAEGLRAEQAATVVTQAAGGGQVLSIDSTTRSGYDCWAVTVSRADGSVITGFVDRAEGVVFLWETVHAAPDPVAPQVENPDPPRDDERHDGEDHDEHEGDAHEDHEGHDGDDDDD